MAVQNKVSLPVIKRLPKYYRYLTNLSADGKDKISSSELAHMMGTTASQVRQDFNCFGGFGQQGYGYNVPELRRHIGQILGLNRDYRMVIVGAGNMGQALMSYDGFREMHFDMVAAFDSDPALIGRSVRGLVIRDVQELPQALDAQPVDIGIVAVPEAAAQAVCDQLVAGGVHAIWNFAPIDLSAGPDVAINNVHLSDSLLVLTYALGHM